MGQGKWRRFALDFAGEMLPVFLLVTTITGIIIALYLQYLPQAEWQEMYDGITAGHLKGFTIYMVLGVILVMWETYILTRLQYAARRKQDT